MTYFPLRAKLTRTEQAAPPGTIVFLPVLESERNNSPRSRSTWLHSRSSISRNRAPVKIKRRRAAAAYGLTMVTRFSGSLGACLDFELDPSGSGQEIPIVSASLIAFPGAPTPLLSESAHVLVHGTSQCRPPDWLLPSGVRQRVGRKHIWRLGMQ
jgi:hypothetical protein